MPRSRYRPLPEGRGRHLLPLPEPMRARLPFLIDAQRMRLIAPWAKGREQASDLARMDAMLECIELADLPAPLCWIWPDRLPQPATNADPAWLAAQLRDRAVYPVEG